MIERGVEFRGEMRTDILRAVQRQAMQTGGLIECGLIERLTHKPTLLAMTPQIDFAQIFDPDETFLRIMKVNFRHANFVFCQKLRDLDVKPVLLPLEIIFYENDCLLGGKTNPIKSAIRSAFFDRRDIDLRIAERGKAYACLMQQ